MFISGYSHGYLVVILRSQFDTSYQDKFDKNVKFLRTLPLLPLTSSRHAVGCIHPQDGDVTQQETTNGTGSGL
jgi:hypothetical protein